MTIVSLQPDELSLKFAIEDTSLLNQQIFDKFTATRDTQ